MRIASTWIAALLITGAAKAQLQMLPDSHPQTVFGGGMCTLELRWRNPDGEAAKADISARIFQASSATLVPLGWRPWKQLTVLPGQTVLEFARLEFPAVNTEGHFIVQWWDGTNRMLGVSEVLVYATNLLSELKSLIGEDGALGVLDPTSHLKPLLSSLKLDLVDLEDISLGRFRGKLAVLGPFASKEQVPDWLARGVYEMAQENVAVVWIQPPPAPHEPLKPSFEIIAIGTGTVVVAQHDLVASLATNPQSQLSLIHCCRLALDPKPPRLPHLDH
jgi:hypothetical protein